MLHARAASLTVLQLPRQCDAGKEHTGSELQYSVRYFVSDWERFLPFVPTITLSCLASTCSPWRESGFMTVIPKLWLNKTMEPSFLAWLPNPILSPFCGLPFAFCKVFLLPEIIIQTPFNGYILLLFLTLGTSSTNTVGGTVNSQAAQAQPPAMTSSRKGTFTDDLHKLVDNWARDAMNLSGRRGSKGHMNYEVSLPFSPFS